MKVSYTLGNGLMFLLNQRGLLIIVAISGPAWDLV